MGIFDGLKQAKVFENGRKLPPGDHVVKIEKCDEARSSRSGNGLYIVEYIAVKSNNPDVEIGAKYSWVQDCKDLNVAQSAIKQFVFAVMKVDKVKDLETYNKVEANCETIAAATVAKQYFKDKLVAVSTDKIRTKNNQDFLRHQFRATAEA
jgi:hypothetical protein